MAYVLQFPVASSLVSHPLNAPEGGRPFTDEEQRQWKDIKHMYINKGDEDEDDDE